MKIIFLWSCNGQNVNFPLITNRVVVGTLVLRKIDWFKKLFWRGGSFWFCCYLPYVNEKHTIFEILMLVRLRIVKPKSPIVKLPWFLLLILLLVLPTSYFQLKFSFSDFIFEIPSTTLNTTLLSQFFAWPQLLKKTFGRVTSVAFCLFFIEILLFFPLLSVSFV